MAPKPKPCPSGTKRNRKSLTLKQKYEIIQLSEKGLTNAEIGCKLELTKQTVCTIVCGKERIIKEIKNATPTMTKVIRKNASLIFEMEKLLVIWIEDQTSHNIPLNTELIKNKALILFQTLKSQRGDEASDEAFEASNGWFYRFKERNSLHDIHTKGEAASAVGTIASGIGTFISEPSSPKSSQDKPESLKHTQEKSGVDNLKVKSSRKFRSEWKQMFPWIIYDSNTGLMSCKICLKAKANTSWCTGSLVIKKDNLARHASSTVHGISVKALETKLEKPIEVDVVSGQYLLKKESHCYTILDELLVDNEFSDVTLTAEGKHIKAHRNILCIASSYFKEVLSKATTVNSAIFFKDIKYQELKNLISFIYIGEVTVNATELDSFMKTAELLGVNALCDVNKSNYTEFPSNELFAGIDSTIPSLVNRKRTSQRTSSQLSKLRKFDLNDDFIIYTILSNWTICLFMKIDKSQNKSTTLIDNNCSIDASESATKSSLEPDNNNIQENVDREIDELRKTNLFKSDRLVDQNFQKINEINLLPELDVVAKVEEKDLSFFPHSGGVYSPDQEKFIESLMGEPLQKSSKKKNDGLGHCLESIPPTEKKKLPTKPCRVCTQNKQRHETRCPFCDFLNEYSDGTSLSKHLQIQHPDKIAYKCEKCSTVFAIKSSFLNHIKKCVKHCFHPVT